MQETDSMRETLSHKVRWVYTETLRLHCRAPETRIASSLSPIEILVALYYGGLLRFDPNNIYWEERDRLVISKGHGSISLYPILADTGYFPKEELSKVCTSESFLGAIPDTAIPGYETINGSLGLGLGVASGMATALKRKGADSTIFVLQGDGELFSGAVWEAIMFTAQHHLDNLVLILDRNQKCMLDKCENINKLAPLDKKFQEFGWEVREIDGHDVELVHTTLQELKDLSNGKPKVLIANTIKGNRVERFYDDPICHIKSLGTEEVDDLIQEIENE